MSLVLWGDFHFIKKQIIKNQIAGKKSGNSKESKPSVE